MAVTTDERKEGSRSGPTLTNSNTFPRVIRRWPTRCTRHRKGPVEIEKPDLLAVVWPDAPLRMPTAGLPVHASRQATPTHLPTHNSHYCVPYTEANVTMCCVMCPGNPLFHSPSRSRHLPRCYSHYSSSSPPQRHKLNPFDRRCHQSAGQQARLTTHLSAVYRETLRGLRLRSTNGEFANGNGLSGPFGDCQHQDV